LRILIYGLNYAPELTGIGKYTGEMAAWLAERGHAVRVITAPPYYPAWRIRDDYRGAWYRTERVPGQPVVYRTPLYVPARPTGIKRIVHLASFMLGSFPVMLRQMFWQPQVVFTVEPTFFCVPLTLFVGKSAGAACWLHVQDFEVDAAFELGLLPAQGPIHDAALRIEKFFTYAFDRVSGISPMMVDRARVKGIPANRAVHFPNWVDVDAIYPLDPIANRCNPFRRELATGIPDIDSRIILLYSGNMGAKQGVELYSPRWLIRLRATRGFTSSFCGDGAFRTRLEVLVAHCPNVTLLPLQPLDRLNDLLNAADIRRRSGDAFPAQRHARKRSPGDRHRAPREPRWPRWWKAGVWRSRQTMPARCRPQFCNWPRIRNCASAWAVPHASMPWNTSGSSRCSNNLSVT
jgi:colanic acid biosynthesis glycosyl transferase WcaI